MARRKALVAGALGIVGSNIAEHLQAQGGWDVVGVSRSEPRQPVGWRLAHADLTDAAACRALVTAEPGITHLFYAARAPVPGDAAAEAATNLRMLVNLVQPLQEDGKSLEHVSLVHGTKWYGSHLGPFRTPALEDDPRHLGPNFYLDQADYIAAEQPGKRWTWSAVRPAVVCGYSLGYPHNIAAVLAAYAAICKALGLPLRFPGTQACFDAVSQATDVGLLAKAMAWAATEPKCANQHLNIVNGDLFRWRNLWDKLARHFGMENGGVQTVSLASQMADMEPLWQSIVKKHGLRPLALAEIANWSYADMSFRQNWDHISSTLKARRLGFHDFVDTEEMFFAHLARFRAERVVPQ
jgi:nucleoside-diphosphate-sugar epimerase